MNLYSYNQIHMLSSRAGLGAPLRRVGLGDAAGDLASMQSTIGAGDTYLAAGEYDAAVQAYQAAGQSGAVTIGPEIDTQTGGASKTLTQQAWSLNGQLAAITSSGSSQGDAQNAQSLAKQMLSLYTQALGQGSTLQTAAQAAVDAINGDPNYCTSVSRAGTAVYGAVHNFKNVWNASGQGSQLAHNGQYDAPTAAAIASVLGSSPAACSGGGGGVTPPNPSPPPPSPLPPPSTSTTSTSSNTGLILAGVAAVAVAGGIAYAARKKKNARRR